MATVTDLINGALRLLGVLAEGETPSSAISSDGLFALNQMIDSWNTERLMVYCTQEQVATWTASQSSMTLGPSGTLGVLNRPVKLLDSTYFKDPTTGISFPIKIVNQEQYNAISLKTITTNYPEILFYNPTEPNATIFLYPVPSIALEFHFVSVLELTQPANIDTVLAFPDGYLRAFRYNLACEIAPEYGMEPPPYVRDVAIESKRNIMNINDPGDVMVMPYSLVTNRTRFNILAGE